MHYNIYTHKQQLHPIVPCLHWCVWCMHIHASVCSLVYVDVLACLHMCTLIVCVHSVYTFLFVLKCMCLHYSYKQSCTCALIAAVSCGSAPKAPANGQRNVSGTTFRSTVTYTCNRGYTLQGDSRRTCMANGQWSGVTTRCSRKHSC